MNNSDVFLFLNLPANDKITRRYMCSYQSPTSLFPPLELLSLAAVYKNTTEITPHMLDAVASKLNIEAVTNFIKKQHIKFVVSLIGFECFEEDMTTVSEIKKACPDLRFIVFGHYPTSFPEEILEKSDVDIILKGEPEEVFLGYLAQSQTSSKKQICSVSNNTGSSVTKNRIKDYNSLPTPAFELVNHAPYHEPMMARPFGMIQSARGCPYSCNYCVRSFGARLTLRSPEKVVEEILLLRQLHKIKALRFIDDTFTVNKLRVLDICRMMIEKRLKIEWSCLSRTDNIDEEMLSWMKRAGCKRIYYGVENGSQRILDFYKKGIVVEDALKIIHLTNAARIESAGFFMLGLPEENEQDFLMNKAFIREAKFDYIGIGGLVLYPGTPLFDIYRDDVEFSLFPYVNRFKDEQLQRRYLKWNKELYDSFLFSRHFAQKTVVKTLQSPLQAIATFQSAFSYHLTYKRGIFHHIQKHKTELNYFE